MQSVTAASMTATVAKALFLCLLSLLTVTNSKFMQRSDIKKSMHYISRQINNNNNKYQKINTREPPLNTNLHQLPATDSNNNVDIFVRRKDIGLWQKYDETLVEGGDSSGQVENALKDMFYAINNVNSFNNNVVMKKNLYDNIILKMPNMKKLKIKDIDVGYKIRTVLSSSNDSSAQTNSTIMLLRINSPTAANNDSNKLSIDKIDLKRFVPRHDDSFVCLESSYINLQQQVRAFMSNSLKEMVEKKDDKVSITKLRIASFSDGSLLKRNNQIILASGGIVIYPFTSSSSPDSDNGSDEGKDALAAKSFQLQLTDIAGVASTPYDAEAATAIGTFVLLHIFQQTIREMTEDHGKESSSEVSLHDIEYYCDSKKLVKDIKNVYKRMYKELPKADDARSKTDSLLFYLEGLIEILSKSTVYVPNNIAAISSSEDSEDAAIVDNSDGSKSSVHIHWIAGSPPSESGKRTSTASRSTYREKGIYLADSLSRNNKRKNRYGVDSESSISAIEAEESGGSASIGFVEIMDICCYILSVNKV